MLRQKHRLIAMVLITLLLMLTEHMPFPVTAQDDSTIPSESLKNLENFNLNRNQEIPDRDPNVCTTCSVIITYANLADSYVLELSKALTPGMQIMFAALVGLWATIQGYKLFGGVTDPRQLYLEFMYVAIASMLLFQVGDGFVNDIYHASLSVMSGASSIAFVLAEDVDIKGVTENVGFAEYENLVRLVFTVEHSVLKVFDLASNMILHANDIGDKIVTSIYALILVVPYFLVALVFLSQVVISVFRLMMLAAFSPFLMMAYAFGWGRSMAQSAIRTLISSIAVMFAVTASVAMVVYAVTNIDLKNISDGLNSGKLGVISISNPDLVVLILLGWMSSAFMAEATSIANSITGSALSNTGAGIITAGVTGSAAFALSQGKKNLRHPASWAGSFMGAMGQFSEGSGQTGSLYQKVKDVSRGNVPK
jgi:type IV secretion system protein TrbL